MSLISFVARAQNIYHDYPAGNIIVDKIKGDSIWVKPDLRDTQGTWFYWNFSVSNVKGRRLYFVLPNNCIPNGGISVSKDGGKTWNVEQPEAANNNVFTYDFKSNDEVRFSIGAPYTQSNWEDFIRKYKSNPYFNLSYLTKTKKGRGVEMLNIKNPNKEAKVKVVLTARHHACEMMTDYVMEGIIETLVANKWVKENVEILCVPFIDKDGVEDGDQGKNRYPRDHNRDYSETSVHESTGALRELLPKWGEGKLKMAVDLHCPWVRNGLNDTIFIVGSKFPEIQKHEVRFSELIKKNNKGELVYHHENFCYYGSKPWTLEAESSIGKKFTYWVTFIDGMDMSCSIETPYNINGGQIITSSNARGFGKDVGSAIIEYLKEITL
jgi:hypothetical protein